MNRRAYGHSCHLFDASPRADPRQSRDTQEALALFDSYRRLADVFHEVLSEQSLDALLEADCRHPRRAHPPRRPRRLRGRRDHVSAAGASLPAAHYADEVIADEPFGFGQGITGWAVANREPVLANRADLDPRVRFVEGTPPDPESLIAVPLIARGSIKGALNIYRVGLAEFSEEEFRLAVRFGDAAALALDNAHARASLELQAQTDPLTGLWNHRSFHERLRNEIVRVSTEQATSVALLMLDLDDFKRVNDIYGHAVGDQVLAELATQLRAVVRETDDVCRTGGEEFAIIVPAGDLEAAHALAERVARQVAEANFYQAGPVTLSIGIAIGPEHAANPRELIACAEIAMMTAKARGKSRIVVFDADESERPGSAGGPERGRALDRPPQDAARRSRASSAACSRSRRSRATIADELHQLIDYHNCRVYLRDGDDLTPVAFRGALTDTKGSVLDVLAIKVGVGITGHVAATGAPFLTGDAANCGIGHHIEGTARIEESLLAVPLRYGASVVGVLVLSKLGLDQFDSDDLRFLEVLAGHASVAFANARLYEAERREAHGREGAARALARALGRAPSSTRSPSGSCGAPFGSSRFRERRSGSRLEDDAGLECLSCWPDDDDPAHAQPGDRLPPRAPAAAGDKTDPFVIRSEDHLETVGPDFKRSSRPSMPSHRFRSTGATRARAHPVAGRDARRTAARPARRHRRPGEARPHQRALASRASSARSSRRSRPSPTRSRRRTSTPRRTRAGSGTWRVRSARSSASTRATLKRVELGALFHDIGKIGIPRRDPDASPAR